MALLVFVAAVLIHVAAVFIQGSAAGIVLDHPCRCLVDSVKPCSTAYLPCSSATTPPWWSLAVRQSWKMSTYLLGS